MTVIKRINAVVGSSTVSYQQPRKQGHTQKGWVCPKCHCQSRLEPRNGELVCALCGEGPDA